MARRINDTLRKLGVGQPADDQPPVDTRTPRKSEDHADDEETQHDRFRRRQARMAESDTSSSLPIKVVQKEDAPKPKPGQSFEGTIEKLIEKYKNPREVMRHLTTGQYMRYEIRGGQIWEGANLIYDGTKYLTET